MTNTIAQNPPIPAERPKWTEELKALEIGESIEYSLLVRANVSSTITELKRNTTLGFTTQKVTETTFRVWRTK